MQSSQLAPFTDARPFEAFTIFVAEGRTIDVQHPEMVMMGDYALGIWILHPDGQLELIDAALITAIRTVHAVDPHNFTGPQPESA